MGFRNGLRRRSENRQRSATAATRRLLLEPLESRRLMAAVVMSDWEQLAIELINRARSNPAAEARRYGIGLNDGLAPETISPAAKQPLAPHQALLNAADAHSQDMLNRDYFSHENPEGEMPWDRMLEAGYRYSLAGENIIWSGTTGTLDRDAAIYDHHAGFMRSPGHRTNILGAGFREIGTGVKHGVFTADRNYNASMLTEKFGARTGEAFITGVIYDDQVTEDNFYTIGEGWDRVTIAAVEASSGVEYVTVSGPSGGYSLQVPPGVYTVTVGSDLLRQPIVFSRVTIANENRKIDAEFTADAIGPPPASSGWQNPENPLDVNDDERITPLDALIVINHINRTGGGRLPLASSSPDAPPPPYLDVTGSGSVGPLDALVIVNHLNRLPTGSGEAASAVDAVLAQGAALDEGTASLEGAAIVGEVPWREPWLGLERGHEERALAEIALWWSGDPPGEIDRRGAGLGAPPTRQRFAKDGLSDDRREGVGRSGDEGGRKADLEPLVRAEGDILV